MFKIMDSSYGDLGLRFKTRQAAEDYLVNDSDYDPSDMGVWIERSTSDNE